MNNGKQGRPLIYENNFKIALAREYLTSNLGYQALAKKYSIEKHHTIRHFVRWYKKHYPHEEASVPYSEDKSTTEAVYSQPDNNKQLSKELRDAHLKIAGLEMLIGNAQKELGVDIIKKSGTKPSRK